MDVLSRSLNKVKLTFSIYNNDPFFLRKIEHFFNLEFMQCYLIIVMITYPVFTSHMDKAFHGLNFNHFITIRSRLPAIEALPILAVSIIIKLVG